MNKLYIKILIAIVISIVITVAGAIIRDRIDEAKNSKLVKTDAVSGESRIGEAGPIGFAKSDGAVRKNVTTNNG